MRKYVAFIILFLLIASVFGVAASYKNPVDGQRDDVEETSCICGDMPKEEVSGNLGEINDGVNSDFKNKEKSQCAIPVRHSWSRGIKILPKMVEASIYTKCGEVEKDTSVLYGLLLPIDVDDDSNTGENGRDIKVRFYILPSLSYENFGWVLAFSVVVEVERLGEELNDKDFEIYLDFHLSLEDYDYGNHEFRLGYASPEGKELPKTERVTFTVYPYLMYDKNPDFVLQSTPIFNGDENDMNIVAGYSGCFGGTTFDHNVVIGCQPAISSAVTFTPDLNLQKINMTLSRTADKDTTLTITYAGEIDGEGMDIALTIDKVPMEMSFSILYGIFGASGEQGMLDYESSNEFNVTLTMKAGRIGLMGCVRVQYLPKHLLVEWTSKIYGGHIDISMSSSLTELIICDDINNPNVYFSISNITNSTNFSWGIDQGGYIKLDAEHEGPIIDFYLITGSMRMEMISQLKTNYFFISWNIDQEGYVTLDTNGNWLNTFSFNFTIDNSVGLLVGASFLNADDFRADWVIWPPNFQFSGDINFIGDIIFSIMIGGTWYSLPL